MIEYNLRTINIQKSLRIDVSTKLILVIDGFLIIYLID